MGLFGEMGKTSVDDTQYYATAEVAINELESKGYNLDGLMNAMNKESKIEALKNGISFRLIKKGCTAAENPFKFEAPALTVDLYEINVKE